VLLLASLYSDALPSHGQRGAFWALAGLLGGFGFIRMSARLMRSPKVTWWPGSVKSGDLHIHHLVWGICTLMITGFLSFALHPEPPALEILAVFFGIGMGLTLDEFALWLYLDDVYWKDEGRKSFEAVLVAVVLGGFFLLGVSPVDPNETGFWAIALSLAIHVAFVAVVLLKGKLFFIGVIAVFIPLVAIFSAFRVARPHSIWARRFYKKPAKLEKSQRRADKAIERRRRWSDRIAGAPSIPSE
jgi:lysyl-tRNA synthetase, class II